MSETREVYSRITNKIITDLEHGVRPWHRPWNAEHAVGGITRPLRHNGVAYQGINVVMLWSASVVNGYACPIWLTFKQARQLGGNVRKGEHDELVVYADRIIRTETDGKGEEVERSIPFMKGYTVFNVEQCEGLPAQYTGKAEAPAQPLPQRIEAADRFFAATGADIRHGGTRAYYAEGPDYVQMPPFETFKDAESHAATWRTRSPTGRNTRSVLPAILVVCGMVTKAMRARSLLPSWVRLSSPPISASRQRYGPIMRPISRHG